MKHYYRNPKTEELIIWDSEKDEILIVEKIRNIQVFLEDDLLCPVGENEKGMADSGVRKRMNGIKIPKEVEDKIIEKKKSGIGATEISREFGISLTSVYAILKRNKKVE